MYEVPFLNQQKTGSQVQSNTHTTIIVFLYLQLSKERYIDMKLFLVLLGLSLFVVFTDIISKYLQYTLLFQTENHII